MKKILIIPFIIIVAIIILSWTGLWKFILWKDYRTSIDYPKYNRIAWSLDEPDTFYFLLEFRSLATTLSPLAIISDNTVIPYTEMRLFQHNNTSNTNKYIATVYKSKHIIRDSSIISNASAGKIIVETNINETLKDAIWKTYEIDINSGTLTPIFTKATGRIQKARLLNNGNYFICQALGTSILNSDFELLQVNRDGETKQKYNESPNGCQTITFLANKSGFNEFAIDNSGKEIIGEKISNLPNLSPDSKLAIISHGNSVYLAKRDPLYDQSTYNLNDPTNILSPSSIDAMVPPYPTKSQIYLNQTN